MKKVFLIIYSFIISTQYAQNWETVVLLPGRSPIKQIEVVNNHNIYVSSQYYKLYNWNGAEWKSVGDFNPGFNGKFYYKSENEIYAIHNSFTDGKDNTEYNFIAKWNGLTWSNLGNFNQPKSIYNFKIINQNEIYAVGEFDNLDDYRWKSVAKYNGTNWNVVGLEDPLAGTYSGNNSLWVNNENDIYSKWDSYKSSGEKKVKHWDGLTWSILRNFYLDEVYNVDRIHVVNKNEIYINAWNKEIDFGVIGMWNGTYWRILGDIQSDLNTGGFYGSLDFVFVNSNEIYAFGSALRDKSNFTYQVAIWNGNKWLKLGSLNANNPVTSAFYKDGFLYVGGSFTETGKTLIKKIDVQQTLSTKTNIINDVKIFPNPIKSKVKLGKVYKKITLFDVKGKRILKLKNIEQIDISNLKQGIYFLHLVDISNRNFKTKIVKI